jgi:hypothetical protein
MVGGVQQRSDSHRKLSSCGPGSGQSGLCSMVRAIVRAVAVVSSLVRCGDVIMRCTMA